MYYYYKPHFILFISVFIEMAVVFFFYFMSHAVSVHFLYLWLNLPIHQQNGMYGIYLMW